MPTEIKQVLDGTKTVLRISGEMFRSDAEFLSQIADGVIEGSGGEITIDIADLDLLDSEAAHILRRMCDERGFTLQGTDVLLQAAIDEAERKA